MNKKIFSLLHEQEVRLEPGEKIISSNSLATALDAEALLAKVKEDTLRYKQEIAIDAEQIKQAAELEGFKAGFQGWLEKIEAQELKIREVREEYKKIFIPALLKMFKKIVGKELEQKEETIVDIVEANLKAVSSHKKIVIYISPKQKNIVEKHKNRLKAHFEELETLAIVERNDLALGDVVIESEKGIVNARFENQLQLFEKAFSNLISELEQKEKESLP